MIGIRLEPSIFGETHSLSDKIDSTELKDIELDPTKADFVTPECQDIFNSAQSVITRQSLEREQDVLALKKKKLELNARLRLEKKITTIIIFYYLVVALILISHIILTALKFIVVSDSVIITLLTVTFVNTIGLLLIIVKYYFPNINQPEK
ncbi:hypothetical protein ACWNT8_02060 [Pigmentibacter ruber]|uniref:hypothetical protein n=1 Tax=Pigmentibacter ruber TaxID=2683196 RepID=UPI00131B4E13|nr:hypothetical protein [Pigmentibacter ruber]BFD30869.1 hypothetical protein GTC16762_04870 [Pigmentibacter ruber]